MQKVGFSTIKFCTLEVGDIITDLVRTFGKSNSRRKFGTVLCACGGVGTAPMFPIVNQ